MGTLAILRFGALAEWAFLPLPLSANAPTTCVPVSAFGEPLKKSSRLTTCVSELLATTRFFFGALAW